MIRFGLRLALAGGREAAARLIIIAAAVALGAGMLLAVIAGVHAVDAQNARYIHMNATTGPSGADPVWWRTALDGFAGEDIYRIDVAVTTANPPVAPGLARLPGPGEFYASPALDRLLRSVPHEQLMDRYPGREAGVIGAAGLPSPDTLMVFVGGTADAVSKLPGAHQVNEVMTGTPQHCDSTCISGIQAAGIDLVLGVVAGALIFPVLMFIGTAARLSALRREQRFAAIRLVGATPRQISIISATESTASALIGTVCGFALFYAVRPGLAQIPFTMARFYPSDLSVNAVEIAAVALGVPLAAAIVARLALRRVQISPLGTSRRVTPRPPRAYRLVPMLVGLAWLGHLVLQPASLPNTSVGQVAVFLPGFLVVMAGLVIAGPWLTMVGARALARRTSRLPTLIAARRLADNPKAGFRAVSGLILALFVTTVAVGVMGTINAERGVSSNPDAGRNLIQQFNEHTGGALPPADFHIPSGLTGLAGVSGVIATRQPPKDGIDPNGALPPQLALCSDIAASPNFGHCAPGARVAWVWNDLLVDGRSWAPPLTEWPAADIDPAALQQMSVASIVVGTDGSRAAVESSRTLLANAIPHRSAPYTQAEDAAYKNRLTRQWQQLADVVILASLVIAGCSLTVSVAAGLNDRKRPFSILRLTGVRLAALRQVVALESAAPLLAAAVVAIATGLAGAQLFLRAQMQYTLHPPGIGYCLLVVSGLAVSLGIIASTLPVLRRITSPETARNE
jgi:hypothetical protein